MKCPKVVDGYFIRSVSKFNFFVQNTDMSKKNWRIGCVIMQPYPLTSVLSTVNSALWWSKYPTALGREVKRQERNRTGRIEVLPLLPSGNCPTALGTGKRARARGREEGKVASGRVEIYRKIHFLYFTSEDGGRHSLLATRLREGQCRGNSASKQLEIAFGFWLGKWCD